MFKKLTILALPVLLIACSASENSSVDKMADTMKEKTASVVNDTKETMAAMENDITSKTMAPKTKAVLIYADWCGSCKILDPKIEKVKSMGAIPGVEFVTLDYTDKDAAAFYAAAEAAGVQKAIETYLDGTVKTGQLLLVDLDDQTVIGKVTKGMEPSKIIGKIKDAVTAS